MLKWFKKTDKTEKSALASPQVGDDSLVVKPEPSEPSEPSELIDTSDSESPITDENISEQYTPAPPEKNSGWAVRLFAGLHKSSSKIGDSISGVFTKRKLDADAVQDLSDILIMSDMGVALSERFSHNIAATRFDKNISDMDIKVALAEQIESVLRPVCVPLTLGDSRPHIIMVVGVNGSGKTTTIGKLAHRYTQMGKSVLLGAGDTFRAAAVEQLRVWADRAGADIVYKHEGADAGALAYETISKGLDNAVDVILLDTAGRLHNKQHLMDELQKVQRVIKKRLPDAPHDTVIVLDGTVGQNALDQVAHFKDCVAVSGIIMTKLDGTAKGGVLVHIADSYKLPIHAIGVGETIDDLNAFEPMDFANALMGIDSNDCVH